MGAVRSMLNFDSFLLDYSNFLIMWLKIIWEAQISELD